MSNKKASRLQSSIAFFVSSILVIAAALLFMNKQYIADQLSVWSYEPSSSIQAIEKRAEFSNKGRFIFYATQPSVQQQQHFNENCPRQEASSPILGCYTTNDRIYIYDLTNDKLDGIEEVTAAHELLHAVWSRTGQKEREALEVQLHQAYDALTDTELKDRMAYYERNEPGELTNELHSILGTEVATLDESLESYYSQYFNRKAVVKLHAQYNDIYTSLYSQAEALYKKMTDLAASITSQSSAYDADVKRFSADAQAFNARARNGGFSSQAQFNSERAVLIARQDALDAQRNKINADITAYNKYGVTYQKIADQIQVLNDSLDSFKQIDEAPSV